MQATDIEQGTTATANVLDANPITAAWTVEENAHMMVTVKPKVNSADHVAKQAILQDNVIQNLRNSTQNSHTAVVNISQKRSTS